MVKSFGMPWQPALFLLIAFQLAGCTRDPANSTAPESPPRKTTVEKGITYVGSAAEASALTGEYRELVIRGATKEIVNALPDDLKVTHFGTIGGSAELGTFWGVRWMVGLETLHLQEMDTTDFTAAGEPPHFQRLRRLIIDRPHTVNLAGIEKVGFVEEGGSLELKGVNLSWPHDECVFRNPRVRSVTLMNVHFGDWSVSENTEVSPTTELRLVAGEGSRASIKSWSWIKTLFPYLTVLQLGSMTFDGAAHLSSIVPTSVSCLSLRASIGVVNVLKDPSIRNYQSLETLDLSRTDWGGFSAKHNHELVIGRIKTLIIEESRDLSRLDLEGINLWRSLETLSLAGCRRVDGAFLKAVGQFPNLRTLDLSNIDLSDTNLREALLDMSGLTTLKLVGSNPTSEFMDELRKQMPGTTFLTK